MKIHKNLTQERWNKFTLNGQMGNVGSDIERIMYWRDKQQTEESHHAFLRALELLEATMADPKNSGALHELSRIQAGIIDYFTGDNKQNTTDEYWVQCFNEYANAYAAEREIIHRARTDQRQSQTSPQTPQ